MVKVKILSNLLQKGAMVLWSLNKHKVKQFFEKYITAFVMLSKN